MYMHVEDLGVGMSTHRETVQPVRHQAKDKVATFEAVWLV